MGGRTGVESCAETRWASNDRRTRSTGEWDSGSTASPVSPFSHTSVRDHQETQEVCKTWAQLRITRLFWNIMAIVLGARNETERGKKKKKNPTIIDDGKTLGVFKSCSSLLQQCPLLVTVRLAAVWPLHPWLLEDTREWAGYWGF